MNLEKLKASYLAKREIAVQGIQQISAQIDQLVRNRAANEGAIQTIDMMLAELDADAPKAEPPVKTNFKPRKPKA